MDGNTSTADNKGFIPGAFVNYFKLATAMAIIRSKDQNESGEECAARLADHCHKQQATLQERVKQLEEQLLGFKQQQLLQQHQTLADTGDSDYGDSYVFPTPPCSSTTTTDPTTTKTTPDTASSHVASLSQHTSFLSSVLTLKALSSDCKHRGIVRESLNAALRNIQCMLLKEDSGSGPSAVLSSTVLQHILDVIVRISGAPGWKTADKEEALEELTNFAKNLIDHLLTEDWERKVSHPSLIIHVLTTLFSKSSSLGPHILSSLVSAVSSFSDTLRAIKTGHQKLEQPHTFENIGYIFEVLEQCICMPPKGDSEGRTLSHSLCVQLRCTLEESLLHISEEFPLFAHYIWNIMARIEECCD